MTYEIIIPAKNKQNHYNTVTFTINTKSAIKNQIKKAFVNNNLFSRSTKCKIIPNVTPKISFSNGFNDCKLEVDFGIARDKYYEADIGFGSYIATGKMVGKNGCRIGKAKIDLRDDLDNEEDKGFIRETCL